MAFYIYQNTPNNKVTIHRAQCRFCNDGNGVQQTIHGTLNGQWFPCVNNPYFSYQAVSRVAVALANEMSTEVRNCRRCNPK